MVRFDTLQQLLGWFVGGVLGDELAGEGAGEEGGRERVHLPARLGQPHLRLVGQRKQSLHSPHDFLLLGERRQIVRAGRPVPQNPFPRLRFQPRIARIARMRISLSVSSVESVVHAIRSYHPRNPW